MAKKAKPTEAMADQKKYKFSSDYIRERFNKQQEDGVATVKCPFGYLDEFAMSHLEKLGYAVKLMSETARETVYRIRQH